MNKFQKIKIFFPASLLFLVFVVVLHTAKAEENYIHNDISVSASSGGNLSSEGENGRASASIEVNTIINNQRDSLKLREESEGEPISIEKKIETFFDNIQSFSNVEIRLNNENDENKQIKDTEGEKNTQNQAADLGESEKTRRDFFEIFSKIFASISKLFSFYDF